MASCPFCAPGPDRTFHTGPLTLGLWDVFPVSPGHALLVTKRHIASWFDATSHEQAELIAAVGIARAQIERSHDPHGFNVGINIGESAGQTIPHLHVHVIPRYRGDVADPRGGVRFVIPGRANYLAPSPAGWLAADRDSQLLSPSLELAALPHIRALIAGGDDPLLPHVIAHIDRAVRADLAVAFVLETGFSLLEAHLDDLLDRGGRLRLLTGDYLGVTEPNVLLHLLDLRERHPERTELCVFESAGGSFHPKSYIFHDAAGGGVALVGSSNLSRIALLAGVEWNFRTITSRDPAAFADVVAGFEALLRHPNTHVLDAKWIERYRARRPSIRSVPEREFAPPDEAPAAPPEPHAIQQRALAALEATRVEGNSAGLVVLATGLGKTWLAAFDSARSEFKRILFVAHRDEILRQALSTFRRIRPDARLGLYTGQEKASDADVLFASIQTLGRQAHLRRFDSKEFDYLIVDEFHHAAARTYRQLIDYFEPRFLLGLTATPERTDGGDLLALCQENLVYRCDLREGIEHGLLSPFHYYGVPDEVNYENIPWRSSRFDEEELTKAVATRSRAQNALEQHRSRGGKRTLAFCCSTRHADFMRDFFQEAGLRVAAVHSGPSSDARAHSLERLEAGELDVVFAVDLFNEGVDLPDVDTVMMLRPTESRILWLQQFGRGLRKAQGKDHLRVIDYIGNHRTFLLKPQTLFDLPPGDAAIDRVLSLVQKGEADLPSGCAVTYDLEAVDILRALLHSVPPDILRFFYEDFRERTGARPSATEMHHGGYRPRAVRKSYGTWLRFVHAMGDMGSEGQQILDDSKASAFLDTLETTPMTRSFKMLVLRAMLEADRFPGEATLQELAAGVRRIARRSAPLQRDLGVSLDDESALQNLLERNPIDAWVGGKGTGGTEYFSYSNGAFRSTFEVPPTQREVFVELVREVVDWRLIEYLDRSDRGWVEGFTCRVSHASGRPILFLPPRDTNPKLPRGWTPIVANGETLEANFVEVAVNVVRRPGSEENLLPDILRGWFDTHAGQPGTRNDVAFEPRGTALEMAPLGAVTPPTGVETGRSYMRVEIPAAFGLPFQARKWQQGFVWEGGQIFLLVTLEKAGMPAAHRYSDRFLSPNLFEWKSQNRHTQEGSAGQAMCHHGERAIPVHLLVRKEGKLPDGKAAPFIYCGLVDFVDWEGEKPITIRWKLRTPLSDRIAGSFGVQ
jgi:superfamily II DNA or RNA helicase/diadenosine tetraphosphate (Ap4A) HIT family hydrolase